MVLVFIPKKAISQHGNVSQMNVVNQFHNCAANIAVVNSGSSALCGKRDYLVYGTHFIPQPQLVRWRVPTDDKMLRLEIQ